VYAAEPPVEAVECHVIRGAGEHRPPGVRECHGALGDARTVARLHAERDERHARLGERPHLVPEGPVPHEHSLLPLLLGPKEPHRGTLAIGQALEDVTLGPR
jgi:hypothetical protein